MVATAELVGHFLHQATCRQVLLADCGKRSIEVGKAVRSELFEKHLRGPHAMHRQALASEFFRELLAANIDSVIAALAAEPLANLVARSR